MVWSRDGNDENDDEDNVKKSGLSSLYNCKSRHKDDSSNNDSLHCDDI